MGFYGSQRGSGTASSHLSACNLAPGPMPGSVLRGIRGLGLAALEEPGQEPLNECGDGDLGVRVVHPPDADPEVVEVGVHLDVVLLVDGESEDRKSTRLNSSH